MRRSWAASLMTSRTKIVNAYSTSVESSGKVIILKAVSEAEAVGSALRLCKSLYPEVEGWVNHQVSVVEIRREWFEED